MSNFWFHSLLLSILLAGSAFSEVQDTTIESVRRRGGLNPFPSNTGFVTPDPIINSSQVWSFRSKPSLHPMKVTVNQYDPATSSGYIFVAPYGFSDTAMYGQSGSLILDNDGNPIWFRPLKSPNLMNTDFRVQTYRRKPVLTFWQGTLATPPVYTNVPGGSSEPGSCYYILDHTYATIETVSAHKQYTSDIHEFLITPYDTALFLSTKAIPMDLTPYGGPQDGYVQNFAIQEVDIHSNKLLFFWSALDHIPLSDSNEPISNASLTSNIWDAYHLNSIGLTESIEDLIVSSRSTWTIYRINKPSGNIVWQLGGNNSDFTIFADGGNTEGRSSENVLYEVQMPNTNYTYRAYRHDWVGTPFYPPSIAVKRSHGLMYIFASWNGSTETTQWEVLAGPKRNHLSEIGIVNKSGFETLFVTDKKRPYYQVRALDADGNIIGVSEIFKFKDE